MNKKKGSGVLLLAVWLAVIALGMYLGLLFNKAYFETTDGSLIRALSFTKPQYYQFTSLVEQVMEIFFLVLGAVALICLLLSFKKPASGKKGWRAILLPAICLPLIFFSTALITRQFTEKGVIGKTPLNAEQIKELQPGESFHVGSLKFTKGKMNLLVKNIADSRNVGELFFNDVQHVTANFLMLFIIPVLLWIALIVRLVLVGKSKQTPASG